jgi:hypothetical protein
VVVAFLVAACTGASMDAELLDRLGIDPLHAEFDEAGTWLGAYTADTTAQDFAKIGLLYLRDGVWGGERILPEGWVEFSRMPSDTNPEFGAHWWLDLERPEVFTGGDRRAGHHRRSRARPDLRDLGHRQRDLAAGQRRDPRRLRGAAVGGAGRINPSRRSLAPVPRGPDRGPRPR